MKPIFISYRRSDLSLEAEWIYNLICTFFGEDIVFFDREEIESGKRWDDTLRSNISEANIVLILIGPKWLYEQLESGKRRLDDPEDWVRKEVMASIENYKNKPDKKWVYPVLLNDAKLPKKEWLPNELVELASFQIEKALMFNIKNYAEAAFNIHGFLEDQLWKLKSNGLLNEYKIIPFEPDLVPNPYELTGFQLPVELRASRPVYPFKGLEFFKREDARIFFGRRTEIGEIIDHFKKNQHLLRFYGQSGVGKSSLLFAGLFPRMESKGWIIKYFRRDSTISLGDSLQDIIDKLKTSDKADSLIILDQVEEIIANPNPVNADTELQELVEVISDLKKLNSSRKKLIRLILSYRKEYDVNIKSVLQDKCIYSDEYWLRDLNESGMREAITGIIKDRDLNNAYHLEKEKGLDDTIINDLQNKGNTTDATPLLQILLRKMWDRVSSLDIDKRIITSNLYQDCKSNDLTELLKERLNTIAEKMNVPELKRAVESGLALDILKWFTTDQDTASAVKEELIQQSYEDRIVVKKLLQAFVDTYLLVRIENNTYRLPHDTLAKAVKNNYSLSQSPGQRASRLLESKAKDIEDIEKGKKTTDDVEFSKIDLAIIAAGKPGMRKFTPFEQQVIDYNHERIQKAELDLEDKRKQLQKTTLELRSSMIVTKSRTVFPNNPTLALRLAEAACKITEKPLPEAESAMFDFINSQQEFCKIIIPHLTGVMSVAFSPDGQFILTGGQDALANLWTLDGKIRQIFKGHKQWVRSVAFSPDGKFILTSSFDSTVRLWTVDGEEKKVLKVQDENLAIAFSPNSRFFITGGVNRIARLRSLDGKVKKIFKGHISSVFSVAFSPDGKFVLTGSADKTVRLWSIDGKMIKIFKGHTDIVNSVAFSPDGKQLISGSDDGTVRLWSRDGKIKQILKGNQDDITDVAFSPNGKFIAAAGSNGTVKIWNLNGETINFCKCSSDQINSIAFSSDSKLLVAGLYDYGAQLWNVNKRNFKEFKGHSKEVSSAAYSQKTERLFTASSDKTARVWDVEGNMLLTLKGHSAEVTSVVFSPDERLILTGSLDTTIKIWDNKGKIKKSFQANKNGIAYAKIFPDGDKIIVVGNDANEVAIWTIEGKKIKEIKINEPHISSSTFSPNLKFIFSSSTDGKFILTGTDDGKVKLRTIDGAIYKTFDTDGKAHIDSLTLDDKGTMIAASTSGGKVIIWDIAGRKINTIKVDMGNISSVEISHDGKFILVGFPDDDELIAQLWSIDGKLKQVFKGHSAEEGFATFSPDSKWIITNDSNNNLCLWKPIWEILDPNNTALLTKELMEEYGIPENIEWGKLWD